MILKPSNIPPMIRTPLYQATISTDIVRSLIVEDNPPVSKLIQSYFEKEGCAIIQAHDGAIAMNEFKNNQQKSRMEIADVYNVNPFSSKEMAVREHLKKISGEQLHEEF